MEVKESTIGPHLKGQGPIHMSFSESDGIHLLDESSVNRRKRPIHKNACATALLAICQNLPRFSPGNTVSHFPASLAVGCGQGNPSQMMAGAHNMHHL